MKNFKTKIIYLLIPDEWEKGDPVSFQQYNT